MGLFRILAAIVLAGVLFGRLGDGCILSAPPDHAHIVNYSDPGEALIHGIEPLEGLASYHLPLSSISAALIFNHAGVSIGLCRILLDLSQAALIFAAGGLLGSLTGAVAGLSVFVLAAGKEIPFYYPQAAYTLLVLTAAGLLAFRAQKPTTTRTLLAASALGVTLLYRSSLAFFAPLLALIEWAAMRRRGQGKQQLLLCLAPYLFLIPVVRMNWSNHRQFIPFEHKEAHCNIVTGALGLVETIEGDWRSLIPESVNPDRSGAVLGWAAREVLTHPFRYAAACLQRAWLVISWHPFLWLLAGLGFWQCRRRREFQVLGLLSLYFALIHCLMSVQANYFTPLWPLLSLLAAVPVTRLWEGARPRAFPALYRCSHYALIGVMGIGMGLCAYAWTAVHGYSRVMSRGPAQAQAGLERAVALSPGDVWLRVERAKRGLAAGDLSAAAHDLSAAIARQPDSFLELQLAWIRMLQGAPSALFEWGFTSQSLYETPQILFAAHVFKAHGYTKLKRPRQAQRHLQAALAQHESSIAVRGALGAPEAFASARLRSTDHFVARVGALLRGRPLAERAAVLTAVEQLVEVPVEAWIDQAAIAGPGESRPLRLELLAKCERLARRDDHWHRIALGYQDLKQSPRAVAILKRLSRENPASAVLFSDLGINEYLGGATSAAIQSLERALQLDPRLFAASMSLATIYDESGRHEQALRTLDRALSLKARGDLGLAAESRGRILGALALRAP